MRRDEAWRLAALTLHVDWSAGNARRARRRGRREVTAHRGSVALVTGGARGLGVEICRQLAQAGIIVWCTPRTLESAQSTAEQLRRAGDVRAARQAAQCGSGKPPGPTACGTGHLDAPYRSGIAAPASPARRAAPDLGASRATVDLADIERQAPLGRTGTIPPAKCGGRSPLLPATMTA